MLHQPQTGARPVFHRLSAHVRDQDIGVFDAAAVLPPHPVICAPAALLRKPWRRRNHGRNGYFTEESIILSRLLLSIKHPFRLKWLFQVWITRIKK
jgi:hypothetical protein